MIDHKNNNNNKNEAPVVLSISGSSLLLASRPLGFGLSWMLCKEPEPPVDSLPDDGRVWETQCSIATTVCRVVYILPLVRLPPLDFLVIGRAAAMSGSAHPEFKNTREWDLANTRKHLGRWERVLWTRFGLHEYSKASATITDHTESLYSYLYIYTLQLTLLRWWLLCPFSRCQCVVHDSYQVPESSHASKTHGPDAQMRPRASVRLSRRQCPPNL